MIQQLLDLNGEETVPDLCARLGDVLGLDGPAPEAALRRACEDPAFAGDLLTCRGAPGFLQALLDAPATRAYERERPAPGNRELVGRAAAAFVRWGRAGFSTVDEEALARREAACLACPHLREPASAVQRLVPAREEDRLGARTGRRVCELCGCNVAKKMRLPSESCPGPHPTRAGVTRWGEPLPQAIGAQ